MELPFSDGNDLAEEPGGSAASSPQAEAVDLMLQAF